MKTKFIFFLLISVFLGVSCQKDSITSKEGITGNPGTVTGSDANANLKSTLTGFQTQWVATTDIIGFYSDYATISAAPPVNSALAAQIPGINTQFGVDPSFTWGSPSLAHYFWAYFPRKASAPTVTAVPITLPSAQTQASGGSTAHVGALDFLVATPVNKIAGDQTTVNFQFNHVFTVLNLSVTLPNGRFLTSIAFTSTGGNISLTSGTIDIKQTTPIDPAVYTIGSAVGTAVVTTTLTTKPENTATNVYMVVLPGTYSGSFAVTTTNNGGGGSQLTTIVRPSSTLARGKMYSVNLGTVN